MLYITGDTHIPTSDIQKLGSKRFPEQKLLNKNDFVIICGDFGGIWDGSREENYWNKWLDKKSFSTLFVDGNHENFDMLGQYKETPFCGGFSHEITSSIRHLMRGYVFELCGKTIFTFGGASSHDRAVRTEGKNWWRQELPTKEELDRARSALDKYKNRVDVILTHCAPGSIQKMIAPNYDTNMLTDFFDELKETVEYEKWFFGHYHIDSVIDEKHTAVFNKIIALS